MRCPCTRCRKAHKAYRERKGLPAKWVTINTGADPQAVIAAINKFRKGGE